MQATYLIRGAQLVTVAELCSGVGLDGLAFVPHPGPDLFGRWPAEPTWLERRDQTAPVAITRTPSGLSIETQYKQCPATAHFALELALQAERSIAHQHSGA